MTIPPTVLKAASVAELNFGANLWNPAGDGQHTSADLASPLEEATQEEEAVESSEQTRQTSQEEQLEFLEIEEQAQEIIQQESEKYPADVTEREAQLKFNVE